MLSWKCEFILDGESVPKIIFCAVMQVGEKFSKPPVEDVLYNKTRSMLSSLGLQNYEKNFKKGLLTDNTLPLLTDRQAVELDSFSLFILIDNSSDSLISYYINQCSSRCTNPTWTKAPHSWSHRKVWHVLLYASTYHILFKMKFKPFVSNLFFLFEGTLLSKKHEVEAMEFYILRVDHME